MSQRNLIACCYGAINGRPIIRASDEFFINKSIETRLHCRIADDVTVMFESFVSFPEWQWAFCPEHAEQVHLTWCHSDRSLVHDELPFEVAEEL